MKPSIRLKRPHRRKRIALGIFNGIAFRYLLQTSFISRLIENDSQIFLICSEDSPEIRELATKLGLTCEVVPGELCEKYRRERLPNLQWFGRLVRLHTGGPEYETGDIFWARYCEDIDRMVRESGGRTKIELRLRRWLVGQTVKLFRASRIFRKVFLYLEERLFTPGIFKEVLRKWQVDEVVVTSLGTFDWDQYFVRDASSLGISSTAIILSWDNTTVRGYKACSPDRVVAWTRRMKKELIDLNDFRPHQIFVGGVPIFDHYFWEEADPNNYFGEKIPSDTKLVFFATKSPNAFPWNPNVIRIICNAIRDKRLPKSKVVARVHPLHYRRAKGAYLFQATLDAYEKLAKEFTDCLIVDRPSVEDSNLNYVMPSEEIDKLSQILRRADVVVNMFSTLNIEGAIFDKPLINVCFEGDSFEYEVDKKARFNILSDMAESHNMRLVDTGGLSVVYSEAHLIESLCLALAKPEHGSKGRRLIVDEEAGPNQGRSGRVIADYVSCG